MLAQTWRSAADSERDPLEKAAFDGPAVLAEHAASAPFAFHEDIRAVLAVVPGYPVGGRGALLLIADAERDGLKIVVAFNEEGGWSGIEATEPTS